MLQLYPVFMFLLLSLMGVKRRGWTGTKASNRFTAVKAESLIIQQRGLRCTSFETRKFFCYAVVKAPGRVGKYPPFWDT